MKRKPSARSKRYKPRDVAECDAFEFMRAGSDRRAEVLSEYEPSHSEVLLAMSVRDWRAAGVAMEDEL